MLQVLTAKETIAGITKFELIHGFRFPTNATTSAAVTQYDTTYSFQSIFHSYHICSFSHTRLRL